MAIKVGINGFGRIGRNVLRTALADPNLEFVAVNDLTDPKTLAHLLKYDSVLGNLPHKITAGADSISIDGKTIKVFKEKDPAALPWESVGAQVVIESTGRFTDANEAKKHLRGTVKKVIISAPAKNEDVTLVMGVNHDKYDAAKHHIISNASCTTNCLAPIAKVIHDNFSVVSGTMTGVVKCSRTTPKFSSCLLMKSWLSGTRSFRRNASGRWAMWPRQDVPSSLSATT